jgi:hypothetical protein
MQEVTHLAMLAVITWRSFRASRKQPHPWKIERRALEQPITAPHWPIWWGTHAKFDFRRLIYAARSEMEPTLLRMITIHWFEHDAIRVVGTRETIHDVGQSI